MTWTAYDATINEERKELILSYLDGWRLETTEPNEEEEDVSSITEEENTSSINEEANTPSTENDTSSNVNEEVIPRIDPFVTNEEFNTNSANKVITDTEIETAYDFALNKALTFTNRLNIDTLTTVEGDLFCKYVCIWTASDLWNKYNIRVTNEDMEDTYVQSYGGLLYKQAVNGLTPFILQKIQGFHRITKRMMED